MSLQKVVDCLKLARKPLTGKEISDRTGLTEKQVRNMCRSKAFQASVKVEKAELGAGFELNKYSVATKKCGECGETDPTEFRPYHKNVCKACYAKNISDAMKK